VTHIPNPPPRVWPTATSMHWMPARASFSGSGRWPGRL